MRYISILLLFVSSIGFSQTGNYYLSHYSPGQDKLDNICFQMVQHENGLMYFATRSGILQFDGRTWNNIPGNGAIYTLNISSSGEIYWGGVNGFGIISANPQGAPIAKKLSEGAENIFQSLSLTDELYFVNEEKIFVLDTRTQKGVIIAGSEQTGAFTGIYEISGHVYVSTVNNEVYKILNSKLVKDTSYGNSGSIVFSAASDGRYLVGLADNQIYFTEKSKAPRRIVLEDQEYLNRSVVVNGSWVSKDLIVIGTLRGGLIFINISNGKTHEIVNYSKGLPDNEIFTLFSDRSMAIWAAHEFGFTRIVPYLPFRSFNHYSGLQGNLLCAFTFDNSVYVGTSLGLFVLKKEEVYEQVSYYVDAPGRNKKRTTKQMSDESHADTQPESKRKGLFRIFKKKEPAVEQNTQQETHELATSKTKSENIPNGRIKKTEKVLRTSNYVYRKVKGIEAKITQLLESNGTLIAAGLGGTYQINGLTSKLLLEAPTRYIYASRGGKLFASTYSDKVNILDSNGKGWKVENLLVNLNDQITHIFESNENEVWLCSLDKVYRILMEAGQVKDVQILPVENPNYDQFVGIFYNDDCILANSHGFFLFNPTNQSFNKVDSLSRDELTNYFANEKMLWYRDLHGWKVYGAAGAGKDPGLLNLFQNIRFLSRDKSSGDLWIITGNNELFKFFNDRITPFTTGFPLILKSVRNGELKQGGRRLDLKSDQDNNSVTIEVVQPDYLASQSVEYRYHLKGLDQGWSDWSQSNNIIEIPYIPSGDYVLQVQSKNTFGEEKDLQELVLNVIPPYWKRSWFYGLEVVLFTFLVLLSFRLSTRYRIISRLLMLLTIIILIQLIETVIGETLETKTSPVIDFFAQVVIAMVVLPVEGYLRKRMFQSLDHKNRFYNFILPKVSNKYTGEIEGK